MTNVEETKVTCPRCGSALTVQLANQRHCQVCSHEFDIERNPVAAAALQEKIGWPIRGTEKLSH